MRASSGASSWRSACCCEICARRARVLRAIKMLRVQQWVAAGKPFGRDQVQLTAARPQQRRVSAFPDESMREQESIRVGKHERMSNEGIAGVVGELDHLPQQRQFEALTDHR